MRNKFIFDLDGTVTREEIVTVLSEHYDLNSEVKGIFSDAQKGNIPFLESFIRLVHVFGKQSVIEIDSLLNEIKCFEAVKGFINLHQADCVLVTSNLNCWIEKLLGSFSCTSYSSYCIVENDHIVKITDILKKENVVRRFKDEGHKVIYVGDNNNDIDAMSEADISIASGMAHNVPGSVLAVADYYVLSEEALCRQLNQLL